MEKEHPIGNLMMTAMTSLESMVDVNTIVGDIVTSPDGTVIIPVSIKPNKIKHNMTESINTMIENMASPNLSKNFIFYHLSF